MPHRLLVFALVLAVAAAPVGSGPRAQSQISPQVLAGTQSPPWLTIGLVVGGAFLGRYLAQRYLSDWRIVHFLAGRAGAGLGAEAAGLATAL